MSVFDNLVPQPQRVERVGDAWYTPQGQPAVLRGPYTDTRLQRAAASLFSDCSSEYSSHWELTCGNCLCGHRKLSYAVDAYRLEVTPDGMRLAADEPRGLFYGIQTLSCLREEERFPCCCIEDWADVAIRCDYLEFRNFYPQKEHLETVFNDMGRRRVNAVIVELENKRPFHFAPHLQDAEAGFTVAVIELIKRCAYDNFIELIPLQQTFGHLEYVLREPEWLHLRELPDAPDELCPSKKDSVELAATLLRDLAEIFPEAKYLHMGCDEVWSLGSCSECVASALTKQQLFIQYVNRLIDVVCSIGKTPLLWHDMLADCTADDLQKLDHRGIIVLWMYDGNDLQKRAGAMLEKFHAAGLTVWGGCAVRCWDRSGMQNYPVLTKRQKNISNWAEVVIRYELPGVVNTNWSAYSALACPYGIYETSCYPACFAAEKLWNHTVNANDFLYRFLEWWHDVDTTMLQQDGWQFEDYYHLLAQLKPAKHGELARWMQLVMDYEEATQGDFPAPLQLFRVELWPERVEEWESLRQRYKKTFTRLAELHTTMAEELSRWMDPNACKAYIHSRFNVWFVLEKAIRDRAREAGMEEFRAILTKAD